MADAAAEGRAVAGRRRPARGASTCVGTIRRPRSPRASPAAATGASARSSSGCGRPGGPSRSGPSGSTWACGRQALAAEGLTLDDVVHRDRDEDEALPWDHISAGLHRDFLWGDWQDALAGAGVEDCRWTPCYDCGACTGSGLEHVVASPVPPAGGSQGTGQDLSDGGRVPVRFTVRGSKRCRQLTGRPAPSPTSRLGRSRCASGTPSWARSASPASGTWPGCGSGRCGGAACRWPGRRGSLLARSSPSAWPCRRGAESLGEYLDIRLEAVDPPPEQSPPAAVPGIVAPRDLGEELRQRVQSALDRGGKDLAALLTPLLPEGITVQASARIPNDTDSLQQEVTSCYWELEVHGVAPSELTARVERLLGSPSVVVRRERKGRIVRRRPPPGVRTLDRASGRESGARRRGGKVADCKPSWPPDPGACDPENY